MLPADFKEIQEKVALVAGRVPLVQLDVCDGRFVPSRSWPYRGADLHRDQHFANIVNQQEGLPQWQQLDYEIDLMVQGPTPAIIDDWIAAGASRIIVHLESATPHHLKELIGHLASRRDAATFLEFGLALALETPLEVVTEYLEDVNGIQLMGIERVGYQGQEFAGDRVFDRVRAFHSAHPEIPITVDGGVNVEHARVLVEAGASRLIIGSAIFGSPEALAHTSVVAALEKFKTCV